MTNDQLNSPLTANRSPLNLYHYDLYRFEEGADISVGMDSNKSVVAIHNNSLDDMLAILCNTKMACVIIEGFKTRTFPKIVIGDLASEPCVLRDPTVDQVISSLAMFEDYYSKKG